jgi:TolB-like protein/DNA-binding winged helix-turn-helix (wHTH) protein/Tfp pilus assembly protein PilF
MKSLDDTIFRIGAWRVDPSLDEISNGGKTVKLEPRAMRVLVCLAAHAGQVVSVEQLLREAWKDVIVTSDSVYHVVAALRRMLADDSGNPSYIANVPRRGYRLVVTVTPWVDPPAVPGPGSEVAAAPATTILPAVAVSGFSFRRSANALIIALALLIAYLAASPFWRSKPVTASRQTPATMAPVSEKSIAVLPFTDMSESKDQEYFADGTAEEIIDLLAAVPELHVPARTSSFYFKGKPTKVPDIARELGVAYVLEGSVRRSGDHLRIAAQLVRADNGYHLWSQTYDRTVDDVFSIQDEIAGAVVKALKVRLLEGALPQATPTSNSEVHTLYLQARSLWNRGTPVDNAKAMDYLQRALALDSKFAPAWALLAQAHSVAFSLYGTDSYPEARTAAHRAAEQALKLAPKLSDSHVAMSWVWFDLDWQWHAANAEIQQALALDPGNADAYRLASFIENALGRNGDALALARAAVARDPLSAWNYMAVAYVQRDLGSPGDAKLAYRKALDLNPTAAYLHARLGMLLLDRGDREAGLAEIERETDAVVRQLTLPYALYVLGRNEEADGMLADAEQKYAGRWAAHIARIYAIRHDPDRVFAWLDVAYRQHERSLVYVKSWFHELKSDPRYNALLKSMNLPE